MRLAQAILLAESNGPGWTVYREYGSAMFRLTLTAHEHKLPPGVRIMHRTRALEEQPPVVYNRNFWNEREED